MVAAMGVGQEGLGAVRGPFNRLSQLAGGPETDRFFRIVENLRAEAAADIGGDDADLVFRQAEDEGAEQQPQHMRVLRRRVDGRRIQAGVVFGDGRSEEHTSELQSLMRNSYAVF